MDLAHPQEHGRERDGQSKWNMKQESCAVTCFSLLDGQRVSSC